jgi:hypothetical protein
MYYEFHCPKCNEMLSAEVDVGEHIVDWGEECDCCNYKFTESEVLKIYDDALADCWGSMIDHAHDTLGNR